MKKEEERRRLLVSFDCDCLLRGRGAYVAYLQRQTQTNTDRACFIYR